MGKKDMTHEHCCDCEEREDDGGHGKAFGLLALAAGVAAGAYFFGGERGRYNRERARRAYEKARDESSRQVEKIKDHISEKEYDVMVEDAFQKYKGKAKTVTEDELENIKDELKKYLRKASEKGSELAQEGDKKVKKATRTKKK